MYSSKVAYGHIPFLVGVAVKRFHAKYGPIEIMATNS